MDVPLDLIPLFQEAEVQYGIAWELLAAQCYVESNFDAEAISVVGARGLAQFMEATWGEWGEGGFDNAFVPKRAIKAQARYMQWLLDITEDVWWALVGYNWGIGRTIKLLKERGPNAHQFVPEEVRDYAAKILAKI